MRAEAWQVKAWALVPLALGSVMVLAVVLFQGLQSQQAAELLAVPGLGKVFQHHTPADLTPVQASILKKDSAQLLKDFYSPHPRFRKAAAGSSASALALAGRRYSNEMGGEWLKSAGTGASASASLHKELKAENRMPVTQEGAWIAAQEEKTANQMSHMREFQATHKQLRPRSALQRRPAASVLDQHPPRFEAAQTFHRVEPKAKKQAIRKAIDPPSPIGDAMKDFDNMFFGKTKAAKNRGLPGVNLWGLHASKDIRNMQKAAWRNDLRQMKLGPRVEKPSQMWTGVSEYKSKAPRLTTLEEEDPEEEEEEKDGEKDEAEEEEEADKEDTEDEEEEEADADEEDKVLEDDKEDYWKPTPLEFPDHSDEKKIHDVHFLSDVMTKNTDEGRLPGVVVDSLGPLGADAGTRPIRGNSFIPDEDQPREHNRIPSDQEMYDHLATGQSFNEGSGAEQDDEWVPVQEVRAHPDTVPHAILPPE